MDEEELGVDWLDIEASAYAMEARRRGIEILTVMFDNEPAAFAEWLKQIPEDEYFTVILSLLTVSEFLVEANAKHIETDARTLLACLTAIAENE